MSGTCYEKEYESEIWKDGFWTDNNQNDYFNLKNHIKISDINDSFVVPHPVIVNAIRDDSGVSKILRDLHQKKLKIMFHKM